MGEEDTSAPLRLEEDHPSIVVVGGFDPRVFAPGWFRSQGLLSQAEADAASLKVLTPDVAQWETEWLLLQVTADRLFARATVSSASEPLRDLVIGILQLLEQTKATALGLNRSMHFDVGGETNWHRIGDALAPKALWGAHLKNRPGMLTLQLTEQRTDGMTGRTMVTVQPSTRVRHGVYFDVNSEVTYDGDESAPYFANVLKDHWRPVFDAAYSMANDVLGGALQ